MLPIKAQNTELWLVRRTSASEAPNYFMTDDFKTFAPLSDVQPQKPFNWLTAELLSWTTFDGILAQGILYKPEDFDPKKKYPVIFNYYEAMSDRLYDYPKLEYPEGSMNIPWFVSHGYLVFTPDIYFKTGQAGQSTVNSVVSAAEFLAKKPFVNAQKMALQGHSFGGFETNFLITHTKLFAAASEGAGVVDVISAYGSLKGINGIGPGATAYTERGQGRMGATLWENPTSYIDNSPIFKVNEVTTPLLIMHNKNDGNVSWAQGFQLFTALRRLNKKAWMLQYDGEGHILGDSAAKDYTIRQTQFFDFYLKGAPPPKWMTQGIPARLKQIDDGLELDTSGRQP
jgi:dipeptidyl aminopeptidase/acylaminoacyl peptidase